MSAFDLPSEFAVHVASGVASDAVPERVTARAADVFPAVSTVSSAARPDFCGAPVVRLPEMALGQGFAWCAALRRLVDAQQPFVLLDAGTLAAGSDADRQIRRCWVKRHAAALSAYCYGLIAIEPQVARRSQTRTAAMASMAGASLRVLTVSSDALAQQLAAVLLKAAPADTTSASY